MRFNSTLFSLTLYRFKDFISVNIKHAVCVYLAMRGDNYNSKYLPHVL